MNKHNIKYARNDGSETLKKLNEIRSKNVRDPQVQAHFKHQRKQSDTPDADTQRAWFHSMKNVLQEVDEGLRCIPMHSTFHFLDVGCCPGGFSSYILSKNLRSTGTGISLPTEDGGHDFLLEDNLRSRLELHFADLTSYQLGPTLVHDSRLSLLPSTAVTRRCDLVLLDGHPLRPSTQSMHDHMKMSNMLLISQLIIGLQAIATSGTIVMKLAKPERKLTAKIMYMFDMLAIHLASWKPVCMHATRDTFYIVAKGMGYGKQGYRLQGWLNRLKLLWLDMKFGPISCSKRLLNDADLDFILSDLELETIFGERLQQLSVHIWQVQTSSLTGWRKVEGI